MSVEDANEKAESEANVHIAAFMEQLDVDEDLALILVQEGFTSLEEIAYVAEEEMLAIEEFDDAMVVELRSRASDILLTRALASEESIEPAQDLLEMEGITVALAQKLASKGIVTKEDLAEQAVDELMEVDGMEEALAGSLIMKARESWFTED